MPKTPAVVSETAPVPTSRSTILRRVAVGVVAFALIGGAVAARFQFAPPRLADDPLRGDSDEAVATLAVQMDALPPAERQTVLQRYLTDPSPSLRYAAVDQLGENHPTAENARRIEAAYTDSSSIVRQRALEKLPDADADRGRNLLLAGLRDEDAWMREAAATQIKMHVITKDKVVDRRALPSLIAALDDADPVVPFTVTSILEKMTGNRWRYRVFSTPAEKAAVHARWKAWWGKQHSQDGPVAAIAPARTDPAPPFQLRDIEGREISLATQRGKLTLLNFWGTWCPPCQKEVPDLVRLDKDYRGRGVDIVGVAVGEKGAPELRAWCDAHGVAYRQALAVDRVQRAYGNIYEVPVSVLIDGEGRIRRRWEGERDYASFRAAIENVLRQDEGAK